MVLQDNTGVGERGRGSRLFEANYVKRTMKWPLEGPKSHRGINLNAVRPKMAVGGPLVRGSVGHFRAPVPSPPKKNKQSFAPPGRKSHQRLWDILHKIGYHISQSIYLKSNGWFKSLLNNAYEIRIFGICHGFLGFSIDFSDFLDFFSDFNAVMEFFEILEFLDPPVGSYKTNSVRPFCNNSSPSSTH